MNLLPKTLILVFLSVFAVSCSDNPQESKQDVSEQVYSYNGLLDSLVGTCSTFLIRTFPLDTFDFTGYDRIRFERESFTDGDLSGISLFYLNPDTAVHIVNLEGISEINNLTPVETQSPKNRTKYFIRMKLNSSVCTGQLYRLVLRNPAIFGVN
jgi:hypothetical protein